MKFKLNKTNLFIAFSVIIVSSCVANVATEALNHSREKQAVKDAVPALNAQFQKMKFPIAVSQDLTLQKIYVDQNLVIKNLFSVRQVDDTQKVIDYLDSYAKVTLRENFCRQELMKEAMKFGFTIESDFYMGEKLIRSYQVNHTMCNLRNYK